MNRWYAIFLIASTEAGKPESHVKKLSIGEVVEDCAERSTESGSMPISLPEAEDEHEQKPEAKGRERGVG